MDWNEMSRESERAARVLREDGCYRSSVSRAYYGAYCAITAALIERKVTFAGGRGNPLHADLAAYIENNLGGYTFHDRSSLKHSLRRLWLNRVDADYFPGETTTEKVAITSLQDVRSIQRILGVSS